jgi:hypothetical protein
MGLKVKQDYVEWLRDYDWTLFGTLTFREGIARKRANRLFGNWIAWLQSAVQVPISWVRMGESSPENDRFHIHVLIAGVQCCNLRRAIALWKRMAGIAQIGKYDPNRRGLEYLLKSMEDTSDFDIDLQLGDHHLRTGPKSDSLQSITPADSGEFDNLGVDPGRNSTLRQRARGTSDVAHQRLFRVDVLFAAGGLGSDNLMPVIGNGNHHGIDLWAGQQLVVVVVALAVFGPISVVDHLDGGLQVIPINIAGGHYLTIFKRQKGLRIAGTLPAHTDDTDVDAVVGWRTAFRRLTFCLSCENRRQNGRGSGDFQKIPPA